MMGCLTIVCGPAIVRSCQVAPNVLFGTSYGNEKTRGSRGAIRVFPVDRRSTCEGYVEKQEVSVRCFSERYSWRGGGSWKGVFVTTGKEMWSMNACRAHFIMARYTTRNER